MTGEVVTGTEERLATGDAVNVAARLEQAAAPGEVLIGEPTLALVRDAVEVEAVEPLELKGKADPVPAYRLLRVRDAPERRHDTPFVGRERELALLQRGVAARHAPSGAASWSRWSATPASASRGSSPRRFASMDATVVRGRCLPYGEGSPTGRSSRC